MKKIIITLCAVAIILVAFLIFHLSTTFSKSKSVSEAANLKTSSITKIVFYDGRGGLNKPFTLENKQKINEFINYLNKCTVKKSTNPISTGWIHSAVFFNNDKELAKITFGDPIIINENEYYKIITNGLSTSKIDNFLKSVNPSWKSS